MAMSSAVRWSRHHSRRSAARNSPGRRDPLAGCPIRFPAMGHTGGQAHRPVAPVTIRASGSSAKVKANLTSNVACRSDLGADATRRLGTDARCATKNAPLNELSRWTGVRRRPLTEAKPLGRSPRPSPGRRGKRDFPSTHTPACLGGAGTGATGHPRHEPAARASAYRRGSVSRPSVAGRPRVSQAHGRTSYQNFLDSHFIHCLLCGRFPHESKSLVILPYIEAILENS